MNDKEQTPIEAPIEGAIQNPVRSESDMVVDMTKAMDLMEKWKRWKAEKEAEGKTDAYYGDTPVQYLPKKKWLRKEREPSLVEQIQAATTKKEVDGIVKKAKGFKGISPKTLRRVNETAKNRLAEIKS